MKKKLWVIVLCAIWAAAAVTGAVLLWTGSVDGAMIPGATTEVTTQATTLPPETEVATVSETTEVTVPETTEPTVPETEETYPTLPEGVELTARYSFVYDLDSEETLYGGEGLDERIYPASITKLFTAIVALEYMDPEAVITAGDELEMVEPDSSVAYIEKGHRLTVSMLIEGMLLPSGNDAAYVLAAGVGRAVSENANMSAQEAVQYFVDLMNINARFYKLSGTQFTNPDGYHAEDHYTTGRDLITIAQLSLEDTVICGFAGTAEAGVTYTSGQTNQWKNTNLLLHPDSEYYCDTAQGLKTGYTGAAGNCLLSAFLVEERYVVIGVFGSTDYYDRFTDTLQLYEVFVEA